MEGRVDAHSDHCRERKSAACEALGEAAQGLGRQEVAGVAPFVGMCWFFIFLYFYIFIFLSQKCNSEETTSA